MKGCVLASGLSTLYSAEASLPSSGLGLGLNTLLDSRKCTFNLGAGGGGGLRRARKLSRALHIISGRLNDPHSTISINNAKHVVHKTGTH